MESITVLLSAELQTASEASEDTQNPNAKKLQRTNTVKSIDARRGSMPNSSFTMPVQPSTRFSDLMVSVQKVSSLINVTRFSSLQLNILFLLLL